MKNTLLNCLACCHRLLALALLPAALAPLAAAQPASPQQLMTAALTDWVAAQHQLSADQVTVSPLDARVPVQPCAGGFRFDYPFVSRDSVRVRCVKPAWQLFVKVGFVGSNATAGGAVAAAAAAPVTAPAPAAAQRAAQAAPAENRQVVVAATNLMPGQLLQPSLLKLEPMDADKINRGHLIDLRGLDGQEVLRPIRAGDPVRLSDLRPAILVRKGEAVSMSVGSPDSFVITVRLEALQDGRLGEQIKMRNPESGRTLTGVVIGKGTVQGG